MTDTSDFDETQEEDEPIHVTIPRDDLRNLRASSKEGKKAAEENAQLKRELAFAKSGIDLTDPKNNYFVKGYDGELTTESIRQAATEAGFLTPPTAPPEEQGAHQRMAEASTGAQASAEPDWDAEYAQAKTESEVVEIARRRAAAAGIQGPAVVYGGLMGTEDS